MMSSVQFSLFCLTNSPQPKLLTLLSYKTKKISKSYSWNQNFGDLNDKWFNQTYIVLEISSDMQLNFFPQ